jgi:hypothetical protein
MNVRFSCAAVLVALGMTIRGDVPPPPDPPPPPPPVETPLIRPALLLDSMKPATARKAYPQVACGVVVNVGRA